MKDAPFSGGLGYASNSNKGSFESFQWSNLPAFVVPHKLRRKLKSRLRLNQSPASNMGKLETSFNPKDTIRALRAHRWSVYDGQYLILMIIGIFVISIVEASAIIKTLAATALMGALVVPVTRQFFLPFLPILAWLLMYFASRFVPTSWRPPIWTKVLPALENIIYGANLSDILSAHTHPILDVLAWLPYGIFHFGAPFVTALTIFVFAAPGTLPVWAASFGYLNIIGVFIQNVFPCAPPWYENLYGLAPAHYGMTGSPGGLARIDQLFGIDLYTSGFKSAPVPFGAMPSLHSGHATMHALFLSHLFPRAKPIFYSYVLWLWWSTLYLQHHYAVDLIAGSLISVIIFTFAKKRFLARLQPDKALRWDYDYVEVGDSTHDYYGLTPLSTAGLSISSGDEWTIGSSSSISSGCVSPVDETNSLWEGETLGSDSEPVEILMEEGRR